jgi:DNA polymerase-3 subunit beta
MKFSILKENIVDELQLLQGIVEKRNTMPILANILMEVDDSHIELTGTDLEVGLRARIEAPADKPGAVTIPGKKVFEIVKSLRDGEQVTFETGREQTLRIASGQSEFKVHCLPREDYPQVPEPRFAKNIVLPLDKVQEMIDGVYFAITQEQRYYLNGAQLTLKNKKIELVSTDGHRLAYTAVALDALRPANPVSVIIAKKTLGELRKLSSEVVEFDLDESNLFFKVKNRTLISRIIESKFPNYEAVLPKDNPYGLVVSRTEIADSIRRVSLLSTERSRGIKFSITKNKLKLFSSNPELGEAKDEIDVDYRGQDLEIGFNAQYLLDFLMTAAADKVRFELKDENSAALLRPEAAEGMTYLYVLMPMKI